MKSILSAVLLFFFSTLSHSYCEIRINNQSDTHATAIVHYDNGLSNTLYINPQKALFINLYYSGYCHAYAYFYLYKNPYQLYFQGYLATDSLFTIYP